MCGEKYWEQTSEVITYPLSKYINNGLKYSPTKLDRNKIILLNKGNIVSSNRSPVDQSVPNANTL